MKAGVMEIRVARFDTVYCIWRDSTTNTRMMSLALTDVRHKELFEKSGMTLKPLLPSFKQRTGSQVHYIVQIFMEVEVKQTK